MKICKNCGFTASDDTSFCPKCGAPMPDNTMNGAYGNSTQYNNPGNSYGGFNMNAGGQPQYNQAQYANQPMQPGFFDRVRMKSNAKRFYGNNTGRCIAVSLICMASTFVPSLLASGFFELAEYTERTALISGLMGLVGVLLYIAIIGISLLIQFAIASWYRKSIYTPLPAGELIHEAMYDIGGKICTGLLVGVKTFLWALLFYFPGIVKTYQYSMTAYIKTENPNISASRAIQLSGIMTNGHKWDLFVMDLSFIGWMLLSGLTMNILGVVYVIPYFNSAKAFAYEDLKAQAIAMGKINPMELDPYAHY